MGLGSLAVMFGAAAALFKCADSGIKLINTTRKSREQKAAEQKKKTQK